MSAPVSNPLRILLLGRFEVARGERLLRAADWTRRKAAALLQRLALDRRLLKDEAIECLWPEAGSASGPNNLYRTLHALRQTLDAALGPGAAEAAFTFEDGVLTLCDSVWVDAGEFERLVQSVVSKQSSAISLQQSEISNLQSAIGLYAGDLLPDDLYADWITAPRETLRRLHRQASLALAGRHREARDYARALARLTPLVERDKADELVHRELMRVYALAGRRHEALRQYKVCVDALAAELDVPPEPETIALYSQILAGELAPTPAPITREIQQSALLVGREAEFSTLLSWMQAARRGQGKTILIGGEAGIGKTLLAAEALCAGAGDGLTPLFGAAYEQEGQLPYQPFVEAFDRHLAEPRRTHADEGRENPITRFKRRSGDPQQDQWAMFNAAADFLTELARHGPVALMVDDLHAADEASLRLFHYLARQTRAAPVLLLATYRADAPQTASPFGALINALYREHLGETLNLSPLAREAVTRMMAHALGGDPAPELASAVHDIAEGNPFFVREITESLRQTGQVERRDGMWRLEGDGPGGGPLRVPSGLAGLLREQVTRLGPPVESALTAASVVGREFDFEVLRGVATLSDGELLDALDAALSGHLLEETPSGYHFRHVLIRHALYGSLSRARRTRLHGLAAARMEAIYAPRPGGLEPHVEDLAYHYDLSDRRDRALDYLLQAGRKAARLFAYEVAVKCYERALELMDALSLPDPERRFKLLESLGKYYKVLADTPRSVAAFDRALALPGDSWRPPACDRARVRRLAAMGLLTAGQLDEADAYLQAALKDLGADGDASELANVLYNVAQLHWHRNEYQPAFEVAQRSLAVAERMNDVGAIARAFEMLALACHSLGEWQTGIAYEQRRAALAGPTLDVTDAFDVHL